MRRLTAIAVPTILAFGVLLQALFAFGSLPAGGYQNLAEAIIAVWVVGFAALACVGIVRWLSRLN